MASRPTWEGHLRLSLVACPVSLYPATSYARDIHFHLINPETGNRIRQVTVDPEAGEVERKELVRGFEYEKDQYVLLTNEEIKSVRLESTRTIDIERFVDATQIDRIWWDTPYYLAPDGKAGIDAFTVIRSAMEDSAKVAIARVVIGTRERVVAIEPRGKGLLLTTLRSHDEIREAEEYFEGIPNAKPDKRMLEIADKIIEQQSGAFDPTQFNDRYEDALRALIESKKDGGDGGVTAPPPRDDNVIDLMEALRKSLEQGGRPANDRGKPAAKARPAAKKPAAKKAPAKAPARKAAPAKRRRAG
ncbi:Ku protein [Roseococcus sp. YIM B11640]|uniref:non-homologous end joining protein Ku n=1 Tax=Roseococcus sp. YIM B11640 TaxID=3133973 RepID=UPI003C7E99CE